MSLSAFSTWTQDHLRGAQRLAQQDEADRDRLDRLIRRGAGNVGDDGSVAVEFCGCGEALSPHATTDECARCRNRAWMRAARAAQAARGADPRPKDVRKAERRKAARLAAAMAEAANGNDFRLRVIRGMAARQEAA